MKYDLICKLIMLSEGYVDEFHDDNKCECEIPSFFWSFSNLNS